MKKSTQVSSADAKGDSSEYTPRGLEARYQELTITREPYLKRGRAAARLTIPSLLPPSGFTPSSDLYKPWQSIGARGVNNLAAKVLLALLPANTPFFRYLLSEAALQKLKADKKESNAQEALALYEREIMSEVESGSTRVSSFEAILHLIVAGNALAYLPLKGGMKVYHLDSYVVRRDGMGNVLEIITEESLALETVPASIRNQVAKHCRDTERVIKLHTCVRREDGKFTAYQEVKGIEVPGSRGTYPLDASPYIPLRWNKIDGEDYGRGHVEGLMGDLRSCEGLQQAIVEGSVAAAKVLFFVNPNGVTKQKTVAEAPNGAVRTGKADDVTVLQMQKFNDFRTALDTSNKVEAALQASFLMASSIQRNAERVTAEEIRMMASELESALGGVYSLLAQEFQLPLVNRLAAQMVKQKRLPPLPKGLVRPAIVTGMEALSRGSDLQRLDIFMAGIKEMGPPVVDKYVNLGDFFKRRATALQLNTKGLIRTDDEVAAKEQQMQQQAAISQLGPHMIKAGTELAKQQGNNPNVEAAPAA